MHCLLRRLRQTLRRFRQDERGIVSTETILVMPLLMWVFMAMFVYWDAFRAHNTSIKASYAIADLISRENAPVNNAFIGGMHSLFRYMVATDEGTWLRVSSVQYDASQDRYNVLWSRTTNTNRSPAHTTATMVAMRPKLPVPANADTLIVVETWRQFSPAFKVGLERRTFYETSVVRPRFLSPLPIS